jgi:hypothetical protein
MVDLLNYVPGDYVGKPKVLQVKKAFAQTMTGVK